jgi:hypothetical protein
MRIFRRLFSRAARRLGVASRPARTGSQAAATGDRDTRLQVSPRWTPEMKLKIQIASILTVGALLATFVAFAG